MQIKFIYEYGEDEVEYMINTPFNMKKIEKIIKELKLPISKCVIYYVDKNTRLSYIKNDKDLSSFIIKAKKHIAREIRLKLNTVDDDKDNERFKRNLDKTKEFMQDDLVINEIQKTEYPELDKDDDDHVIVENQNMEEESLNMNNLTESFIMNLEDEITQKLELKKGKTPRVFNLKESMQMVDKRPSLVNKPSFAKKESDLIESTLIKGSSITLTQEIADKQNDLLKTVSYKEKKKSTLQESIIQEQPTTNVNLDQSIKDTEKRLFNMQQSFLNKVEDLSLQISRFKNSNHIKEESNSDTCRICRQKSCINRKFACMICKDFYICFRCEKANKHCHPLAIINNDQQKRQFKELYRLNQIRDKFVNKSFDTVKMQVYQNVLNLSNWDDKIITHNFQNQDFERFILNSAEIIKEDRSKYMVFK